jgi:hypothetical protein
MDQGAWVGCQRGPDVDNNADQNDVDRDSHDI